MQHSYWQPVMGLRFDLTTVTSAPSRQRLMLESIAAETERTRTRKSAKTRRNFSVTQPVRGFVPAAQRQHQTETTLADLLPWPALLTLEGCAENAAQNAGCTKKEILQFALSICPYEHIVTLLNYVALDKGIADTAKILSPLSRGLKAKEARIKQGASAGGKKSARTRQSDSKTRYIFEILQERERLLASGRGSSEVAGILAQRFGLHPNTIRRKLHAAAKAQEG